MIEYGKKGIKKLVFISCALVLPLVVFLWEKTENSEFLGLREITMEEKGRMTKERRKAKDDLLGSLYFNQEEIVKGNGDIYYLPLSMEEKWERVKITGKKEENIICIIKEGERKKKQEYQSGKEVRKLFVYNEDSYQEVTLCMTALPVLSIEFMECPREVFLEEEEIYSKLYFYAPKKELEKRVQAVHSYSILHKRGDSSKEFEKCGLKLKLIDKKGKKKNENLLGLRKDDDWVLIPMYAEESKLRDKFAIDLWREIADGERQDNRGTRMEYVELILNGVYYGLYGLAVPIDKKQLGLVEHGEESDLLFCIDTTAGVDLAGLERAGESVQAGNITVKFPKSMNQEKWNTIRDFFQLVYFQEDRIFAEEIENWVEMDNMADFYLFLNVIYGKDNTLKNMYYCMRLQEDGTYRVSLIPWDMDLSFGTLYDGENQNGLFWKYDTEKNLEEEECACYLTKRIRELNIGKFEAILKKRYGELRQYILKEEKLFGQIESLSEQIICSGAFYRDLEAWRGGGHSTDYSMMREAIRRRLIYLSDLEG